MILVECDCEMKTVVAMPDCFVKTYQIIGTILKIICIVGSILFLKCFWDAVREWNEKHRLIHVQSFNVNCRTVDEMV